MNKDAYPFAGRGMDRYVGSAVNHFTGRVASGYNIQNI
jgi:hypothetical protein